MKYLRGGVTAPTGFVAAGVRCGIRKTRDRKDLALVYSERECTAAACYTLNQVVGQPLIITKKHLADGIAHAIIVNSGNANTCTGEAGLSAARRMAELVAERLPIKAEDVVVASTGVIGVPLDISVIEAGMEALVAGLSRSGSVDAREAIMTTDTMKKEAALSIELGGATVTLGGMAKGSGMIHPNMATMLSFITTDCSISRELLQEALSSSVRRTYNRVSVDGDTSTNDMVVILANGAAGNRSITEHSADYRAFSEALDLLNTQLTRLIARDGEGATKLIECTVSGAVSEDDAEAFAKSVISSSLVKTALFGSDANWGRVLCALGYTPANFDPGRVALSFESSRGYLEVCRNGAAFPFSEEKAKEVLGDQEVSILVDLGIGGCEATAWGCDLSYEYVRINGDYRT